METKQEQLLSRVVVNHLFLSQFEPFRGLLRTLFDINPDVAIGILKSAIESGGQIGGVLWSKSVPSPAHLAFLCLGELTALRSRPGFGRRVDNTLWVTDTRLVFDNVEYLLLVELLKRIADTGKVTLIQESADQLWESGKQAFRNFGKAAVPVPVQVKKGKGKGKLLESADSQAGTSTSGEGARLPGANTHELNEGESRSSPEAKIQGTVASPSLETPQIKDVENEELYKLAAEFFSELFVAGTDRLESRLKVLDVFSHTPEDDRDQVGEGVADETSHGNREGVPADGGSAVLPSGQVSQEQSPVELESSEVGIIFGDKHRTMVRKLTLYHPDLMHALSTNIRRQRCLKRPVPRSRGGASDFVQPEPRSEEAPASNQRQSPERDRRESTDFHRRVPELDRGDSTDLERGESIELERGDSIELERGESIGLDREESSQLETGESTEVPEDESADDETLPADKADEPEEWSAFRTSQDEEVGEKFKLGDIVVDEVQKAHIEQMKDDIRGGKLAKAIQHLRYLHDGTGIPDSEYREVIRLVIQGTRKNVDPRKSPRDRRDDASIYKAYEQVIASGSARLASVTESIQDELAIEAAQGMNEEGSEAIPPALIKLHKRLETRRAVASTPTVSADAAWIRTCRMELYQYARVMKVHVLETVMQAAFTLIKAMEFQKAADVLASYPRLQPLATVMGWDLLAGKTSARRRLMEVLWASRQKSARFNEGSSSGRSAEEVSCIDELCDQLCYRLEVAYFVALKNAGGEWQASESKIFGNPKSAHNKSQEDQPPADEFVANLALERLAMHAPVGVIFDLVPNISFREALHIVEMQPVGESAEARSAKQLDIELLQMSFGILAAVRALAFMEASAHEDRRDQAQKRAKTLLHELRQHLDAVTTPPRKIWMMETVVQLLYLDQLSSAVEGGSQPDFPDPPGVSSTAFGEGGDKPAAAAFISDILMLLRHSLSSLGLEVQDKGKQRQGGSLGGGQDGLVIADVPDAISKVWNRKAVSVMDFVEDWEWRLEVLQRVRPSLLSWQWKEALGVLRSSSSTLLNMCVQSAQYDLGEEAVRRYNLPKEEVAALQLAQWVDGPPSTSMTDGLIPRVVDDASATEDNSSLLGSSASLPPLTSAMLLVDAAVSAKSVPKARQLLDRARVLLSQTSPAGSKKQPTNVQEQKQDAFLTHVLKKVVQRFQDLLEQDNIKTLQTTYSGADIVSSGIDVVRQGPKQRAFFILHQIIEDAYNGKRQFLSGKLHNLVKALSDEDDDTGSKQVSAYSDRKQMAMEHGLVTGLGFQSPPNVDSISRSGSGDPGESASSSGKVAVGKRFLAPLSNKPTAYLSAFILYIATVGDIVDGADTTHDFNYFSLIYERPNDLLTRLMCERGNADAAGKVAEIMGEDLVHQVITACVPPVYPPSEGEGWAHIPLFPSREFKSTGMLQGGGGPLGAARDDDTELYVLQRDVVKHLATLSPVRAILACVFGSSRFTRRVFDQGEDTTSRPGPSQEQLDDDQWLYEFALEQSERYSTLNRWIQIQANLQRLSESPFSTKKSKEHSPKPKQLRRSKKRYHVPGEETGDEEDSMNTSPTENTGEVEDKHVNVGGSLAADDNKSSERSSIKSTTPEETTSYSILLDWDNDDPYKDTVKGLMNEDKLVDALAIADRYLQAGAPDELLQQMIEREEVSGLHSETQWQGQAALQHNVSSSSWQYCIRLRNKELAATLALKYFRRWELDAAIDVFTMCNSHLEPNRPLYAEVFRVKRSLQQYGQILQADSRFSNWREVEALCQSDPEGLALRLASRGAVTTALGVAESFKLPIVTRRELQGRQLVQLLTSDPTTGGGPAAGLKFLKSLQNDEDALPVAMAAMEQLSSLRSKQLLVHFFLKGRVGILSEDEQARLERLALGLRMLGALPLPWQQRCSALHEHPRLILETLLMWKQLDAAAQLVEAFPSLRDDELVILYASKAITTSTCPVVERRSYPLSPVNKPPPRTTSNFTNSITNLQRRAFSWAGRESSNKALPKEVPTQKQKGRLLPSPQIAAWEAMAGIPEESAESGSGTLVDGHDRHPPVNLGDEWVLTGDSGKDDAVRKSHRYESAPSASLFQAVLSLCSDESVAAKTAVDLCTAEIQKVLCAEHLPVEANADVIERAYYATEAFVQILQHSISQLQRMIEDAQSTPMSAVLPTTLELNKPPESPVFADYATAEKFGILLTTADTWLNHVELLQALLGSTVTVSLDDVLDQRSASNLRDRLIGEERYNLALYTCTKCKIDALPVWEAWGHALLRIGHYAQAQGKFKQALSLCGDPGTFVHQIIQTMESGPPANVKNVQSIYEHVTKSASPLDDSMSANAYLNVLSMPFYNMPDKSRRPSEDSADSFAPNSFHLSGEDFPIRSNLDDDRYNECVYYLQEYGRQYLLPFTFRHGRYYDACLLFFPAEDLPPPLSKPTFTAASLSQLSLQHQKTYLDTDYGTIDDLCEYCVSFGAMPVLEKVLSDRSNSQDDAVALHTAASLTRICTYCETLRHFNHLYRFQVLKKDYVAAGLCCIQLFLNSSHQDEALHHLENAKAHFDEGVNARQQAGDGTRGKPTWWKLPTDKLTDEEILKFATRINYQMEVVRAFSEAEGPFWKRSLFGNPNDGDTFKRRCDVAEALVERNYDLAYQIIFDFGLPAVHIYAGVAASLAEKRKSRELSELQRQIKSHMIDPDDLDQVLGAAINVYANKHRERPDRLILDLSSNHRKVLAYVICGRLKTAFQTASKSGSVADVQYVMHQARQSGSKAVQDLCAQWLATNS